MQGDPNVQSMLMVLPLWSAMLVVALVCLKT